MEYITRASSNIIRPTCQEKQLLTSPYYLIKFKSEATKDIRYCICSDSSAYPARYQKLTIVETSTPTASTNEVKLDTEGTWYFWIYEQASSTNIDPTGLNEVQSGLLTVSHTAPTIATYSGYATTYKQYNG